MRYYSYLKPLTAKTDSQKLNMYAQPRMLGLTTLAFPLLSPKAFLNFPVTSRFLLS